MQFRRRACDWVAAQYRRPTASCRAVSCSHTAQHSLSRTGSDVSSNRIWSVTMYASSWIRRGSSSSIAEGETGMAAGVRQSLSTTDTTLPGGVRGQYGQTSRTRRGEEAVGERPVRTVAAPLSNLGSRTGPSARRQRSRHRRQCSPAVPAAGSGRAARRRYGSPVAGSVCRTAIGCRPVARSPRLQESASTGGLHHAEDRCVRTAVT